MGKITKKQLLKINAEFLSIPYIGDLFIEELGIDCFSDIKREKFIQTLELARQFREYAIGLSVLKRRRLQSKSRERGRNHEN